jgi:ATP-dependent Clp protease ATP-binding subunit ClpC
MQLANMEAQRLNCEHIAPEHILLGIIKQGPGVAVSVLEGMGVDVGVLRSLVEAGMTKGLNGEAVIMGRLPHTPAARKVVEQAVESARQLSDNYVGTEHILLGVLRVPETVAVSLLVAGGVSEAGATVKLKQLRVG